MKWPQVKMCKPKQAKALAAALKEKLKVFAVLL